MTSDSHPSPRAGKSPGPAGTAVNPAPTTPTAPHQNPKLPSPSSTTAAPSTTTASPLALPARAEHHQNPRHPSRLPTKGDPAIPSPPALFTLDDLCAAEAAGYAIGYAHGWVDGDRNDRERYFHDEVIRPIIDAVIEADVSHVERETRRRGAQLDAAERHTLEACPWPPEPPAPPTPDEGTS